MFEITGEHIKELSDSDLRALVALLCEDELRSKRLPPAGVTCGGHQNAKDGGLDVRVELEAAPDPDGFIPRSTTGYQVKKSDMPHHEILEEMCPKGKLRQVIRDLANVRGAYIIVSGAGSTSDSALEDRRKAMAEAVAKLENAANLKLDFYDRTRLATWVRSYPSLVLWVREKIGKPIPGWKPYENWANTKVGLDEEYLLDEQVRIHDGTGQRPKGMTAVEGINRLREILSHTASSGRLVGLSGVGKTRLAQALFDNRVGEHSLNPSWAVYTDTANSPSPDPRTCAESLIAKQRRAILVVDNCSPGLHRRLTSVCTASGSCVSLLTIEYDVREDQPEDTDVFRLEPCSVKLVEKIIRHRFEHIGQVDARTIADFSGGNARLAIALANTVHRGETVIDLKDEDLFERLFLQRNERNNTLLRSAEVCSLVYSFNSQTIDASNSELGLLGSLIDRNANEMFSDTAELKRRDLLQQRGDWRAVLPQAIANRLAKRALENIPTNQIISVLVDGGNDRLLKSFTRRLGYLHDSDIAVEIAEEWLAKEGKLGDVMKLGDLEITLLCNVAPLSPKATLAAIERAASGAQGQQFTSRENPQFYRLAQLLRSLAYDPELFERCVDLLCRFVLSEAPNENHNSVRDILRSLFYPYLSGTNASADQRLTVIRRLARSEIENEQELGLELLNVTLEASHFSSHYGFDFGARPRGYGYAPESGDQIKQWYARFLGFAVDLATSNWAIATRAKQILSDRFHELWARAVVFDELESAATSIRSKGFWSEGWVAVRKTVVSDHKAMGPEILQRIKRLDQLLAPVNLIDEARTYALSTHTNLWDLIDTEDEIESAKARYERVGRRIREIGRKVACDQYVFRRLLPEIVMGDAHGLYSFGQGLAEGSLDQLTIWNELSLQLRVTSKDQRSYNAMRGFLNMLYQIQRKKCNDILDEALTDGVFVSSFPLLQMCVDIDERGV